jgi:hypothetical protein
MEVVEKRDPAALLPATLPEPLPFTSQRDFVRQVLDEELSLRARGMRLVHEKEERGSAPSLRYRAELDAEGSPSDTVAEGYRYHPGTELAALIGDEASRRRIQ